MSAMKVIPSACLLLVVGAAGTAPVTAFAQGRLEAVARWEYRVLTKEDILVLGKKDLAAGLNQLGEDGWELVAAEPYIFKRPKDQLRKQAAEIKRRIAIIEADVEQLSDRAAWAERMGKKGYLSEQRVEAEKRQLKLAETALENARNDLKAIPAELKEPPEPERKPAK
jgi:hypothetical protein